MAVVTMLPMSEFTVRQAGHADRPGIIELCRATLGWSAEDPDEEFFAWKHDHNVFGPSPSWVAVADGVIVGVRLFMRWEFDSVESDRRLRAVRAVDTATSPDWQGRGIFNRLTLGALPELRRDGVDFVFNTPNDRSRPGYLKMGWSSVGRLPVAMRPTGFGSVTSLLGARTAAERWSQQVNIGEDPGDVFADEAAVESLLRLSRPGKKMRTARSASYMRWRYSFPELRYRVIMLGDTVGDGLAVLRFRRRGGALEGVLCDHLVPCGSRLGVPWAEVAAASGCDYFLKLGYGQLGEGFVPVPRNGPILTWKPLVRTGVPSLRHLALTLGDVELF